MIVIVVWSLGIPVPVREINQTKYYIGLFFILLQLTELKHSDIRSGRTN